MRARYRKWRDRRYWNSLTSQAVLLDGQPFRVTARRGKIIGIETWLTTEHEIPQYEYLVWKEEN